MAECSQKFKDMLSEFGGDCSGYGYPNGWGSDGPILQYVAELEAIRDKVDGYAACAPDYAYELQAIADAEAAEFEREYLEMTGGMP